MPARERTTRARSFAEVAVLGILLIGSGCLLLLHEADVSTAHTALRPLLCRRAEPTPSTALPRKLGRLLLHFGPPKTATTNFQDMLLALCDGELNGSSVVGLTHASLYSSTLARECKSADDRREVPVIMFHSWRVSFPLRRPASHHDSQNGFPLLARLLRGERLSKQEEGGTALCVATRTMCYIEQELAAGRDVIFSSENFVFPPCIRALAEIFLPLGATAVTLERMPAFDWVRSQWNQNAKNSRLDVRTHDLITRWLLPPCRASVNADRNGCLKFFSVAQQVHDAFGEHSAWLLLADLPRERGGLATLVFCLWLRAFSSFDECLRRTALTSSRPRNPSVPNVRAQVRVALLVASLARNCTSVDYYDPVPDSILGQLPQQCHDESLYAQLTWQQCQAPHVLPAVAHSGDARTSLRLMSCNAALVRGAAADVAGEGDTRLSFHEMVRRECTQTTAERVRELQDLESDDGGSVAKGGRVMLCGLDVPLLPLNAAWQALARERLKGCTAASTIAADRAALGDLHQSCVES